jgi:DNA-3-methyladenine glycosylase I
MRCAWAETQELFIPYHDEEWCVPVHEDRVLFEMLTLEGAQAGLSWLTILKKRDSYRRAFNNFRIGKVAAFDDAKQAELLQDPGIIRNRLKVAAAVNNAQAVRQVQKEFGSFDVYLWGFVDGRPIIDGLANGGEEVSVKLSKDLKKREFRFVGPTTVYAFMQAVGLVNDHQHDCFRFPELGGHASSGRA